MPSTKCSAGGKYDILRDRGALLRETPDGLIENAYTLKLINFAERPREFAISVTGVPGAEIVGTHRFSADPGSLRTLSLTVAAPADTTLSGIQPLYFKVQAEDDPSVHIREKSSFALPGPR